jgi:hypothetical protein
MLQLQNIKRDVTKKLSVNKLKTQETIVEVTNESVNMDNQTTNINDLQQDTSHEITPEIPKTVEEPKPIMEYENFGAEIK